MRTILYITAPVIYILIILFSLWIGLLTGRQRRGVNIQPIIAILAGLSFCPLMAVMIQLGKLNFPSVAVTSAFLCAGIGTGFILGFIYLWLAKVVLNNSATTSLFLAGSVAGSTVCLYLYIYYADVQPVLISLAWGFLFGALMYVVLVGGPKDGGLQGTFQDLIRRAGR